jgi:D-psicose/D-tagatose/L-ribulose 3-epimerase
MERQYGVCTWTYGPRSLRDIALSLARLGYDGVELHGDLDAFRPREARALLADHGLRIFSMTPANVDAAHPDTQVRTRAINYYHQLVDFAADAGGPMVSVHGYVGRVAPCSTMAHERGLLIDSLRTVAGHAKAAGIKLVLEVLNRYESHLANTAAQASALLDEVDDPNLHILLDTYHMNIEEADPTGAVRAAGQRLGLFHVADSNREGVGSGHIDFPGHFGALDDIGYEGPVIVECTAPGPDPFTPVKAGNWLAVLEGFLGETRSWLGNRQAQGV